MDVEAILKTKPGTDEGTHALFTQACSFQKIKNNTHECVFFNKRYRDDKGKYFSTDEFYNLCCGYLK
jgi:hypothetical protein